MPDPKTVVVDTIQSLVQRRNGAGSADVPLDADLFDDLGLESLDIAELSAILEEEFERDPYSAGLLPRTATDVIQFYAS